MKLFKCCNDNKNIIDEETNQISLNTNDNLLSNNNNNNQTNNVIQDKDEKNINEQLENKDKEIANLNKKIEELTKEKEKIEEKNKTLSEQKTLIEQENKNLKIEKEQITNKLNELKKETETLTQQLTQQQQQNDEMWKTIEKFNQIQEEDIQLIEKISDMEPADKKMFYNINIQDLKRILNKTNQNNKKISNEHENIKNSKNNKIFNNCLSPSKVKSLDLKQIRTLPPNNQQLLQNIFIKIDKKNANNLTSTFDNKINTNKDHVGDIK